MPVSARVIRDAYMAAGITLIDMPAQDRSAARFDGRHGLPLKDELQNYDGESEPKPF